MSAHPSPAIRIAAGAVAFLGAWLLGFSPVGRAPCGGAAEATVDLVEPACADAETASACGQKCDGESAFCDSKCVKKEEPCFKACKPTEEEAKKQKTLADNKCLSKCADKLQPCIAVCHATRAACRGKCPSP